MSAAYFLFYGRLNDFLPRDQREQRITIDFYGRQSIKHLAESLGVPHPEIGQIQVNSQEGTLGTITQDGDQVELHPILNGCPVEPRFVLDNHLGRLTAYLRMLGFDCLYQIDYEDEELAEIAQREERILLSRDRRLLMRKVVTYGYCLRSLDSIEQVKEVIQRFDLTKRIIPFHRCLRCNHLLESVEKEAVLDRLEPLTKLYFDEFQICPACKQIYWKGSHYEQMEKLIEQVRASDTE
ncbi:MAG TPA: Mut7-C RNAse domain-containing protein [Anaerolineales bacterium]